MDVSCLSCYALHWQDERLSSLSAHNPKFGICCDSGKVNIPFLQLLYHFPFSIYSLVMILMLENSAKIYGNTTEHLHLHHFMHTKIIPLIIVEASPSFISLVNYIIGEVLCNQLQMTHQHMLSFIFMILTLHWIISGHLMKVSIL